MLTVQPVSQVAAVGLTVRLLAMAVGQQPLSYQWQRNGTNLAGATTNSLTLANVQCSDAGAYTLLVSNSLGSATLQRSSAHDRRHDAAFDHVSGQRGGEHRPGTCSATNVALGVPATADNCGVASVTNDAPAVFPKGTTTVTWTVTDTSGNTNSCLQTVTVIDTEPPTISCPTNVVVSTDAGTCQATNVALGVPATADNCRVASVTNDAPAVFPKGTTPVTWTVTDTSGNTNSCVQTVTVIDTEPPTISCPTNVVVSTDAGTCQATDVALGVPATADNCGVASVTNDAPAVFPVGTTR